jgi:hypothetical protein
MKTGQIFKAAGLLLLVGLVAGCEESIGIQTETHTVEDEGARFAEIDLKMGAGELVLRGADQDSLLEGTFIYNRSRLKPNIDYRLFNETGILRIRHAKRSSATFGNIRNEWDLRLSKDLPIELKIKLGAGQSTLDLRGIQMSDLDIDMGVGEMILDLQGPHSENLDVRIDGGVGSGTIYLPADVGVRVRVDGGLGSIHARGLKKDGRTYTNGAYGRSDVEIEVDIDVGIGSLTLKGESRTRI